MEAGTIALSTSFAFNSTRSMQSFLIETLLAVKRCNLGLKGVPCTLL